MLDISFSPEGNEARLVRHDTILTMLDTFPLPDHEPQTYELIESGRTRMAVSVPLSPQLQWLVARDGTLWFGITGDYRLYQRTLAGDTLRIVEMEYEPIPITSAERDELGVQNVLRAQLGGETGAPETLALGE